MRRYLKPSQTGTLGGPASRVLRTFLRSLSSPPPGRDASLRTLDAPAMARVKTLLGGLSLDEQEELHAHLQRLLTPALTEGAVAELSTKDAPTRVTYRAERIRCGKPTCACARGKLHGPYVYKCWREGGKARKKYVGKASAPAVRALRKGDGPPPPLA